MAISELGPKDLKILLSIANDPVKKAIVRLLSKERSSDLNRLGSVTSSSRMNIAKALFELERQEVLETKFERLNESDSGSRLVKTYRVKSEFRPKAETLNSLLVKSLDDYSKSEKPSISSIVLDPTVLNTRERLTAFIESMIYKEYETILPSIISSLIQEEEWNQLVSILRGWEWNLDRTLSEEWFESADFKNLCRHLREVCISPERVRQKLSPEERDLLLKAEELTKHESAEIVGLARELITIAVTKKAGIVSYTRHLKRWLKKFRRVIIFEITEKTDALSRAKAQIRDGIRGAGWKGRIFVIFLSVTVGVALENALPAVIVWLLAEIFKELGEEVIVGLITDGA